MPEPGTPFDQILEQRAAKQTDAEKKAQADFRRRVQSLNGTVSPFEDAVELGVRVSNHVTLWNQHGLRAVARGAASISSLPPVQLLGRNKQEGAFKAAWDMLAENDLPSVAGFLVHGAQDAGQSELIARLVDEAMSEAGDLRRIVIRVGASWERKDLATLLRRIGYELQPGWIPQDTGEVGARLVGLLADADVGLEIHNLQECSRNFGSRCAGPFRPSFATAAPSFSSWTAHGRAVAQDTGHERADRLGRHSPAALDRRGAAG
jgi:hypothetical protein